MFKYLILICCCCLYTVNPIQSLLWLVLVFLLSGFVLIEVGAEFLAILLIMVYIGAIAVLFLFIIMLLNIRKIELNNYYINYLPIFFFISVLFFFEIIFIIYFKNNNIFNIGKVLTSILNIDFFWITSLYYTSNTQVIGILLYTIYYHYFFFLSLILLIALLGTLILLVNTQFTALDKININYYKKKWKF